MVGEEVSLLYGNEIICKDLGSWLKHCFTLDKKGSYRPNTGHLQVDSVWLLSSCPCPSRSVWCMITSLHCLMSESGGSVPLLTGFSVPSVWFRLDFLQWWCGKSFRKLVFLCEFLCLAFAFPCGFLKRIMVVFLHLISFCFWRCLLNKCGKCGWTKKDHI